MTTKRTHGPCTCYPSNNAAHQPDCPSLYPAQQEPDALTKLARLLRQHQLDWAPPSDAWTEQALALISEAREEQRRAVDALFLERSAVDLLFHSVLAGKDKGSMSDALQSVERIIEAREP